MKIKFRTYFVFFCIAAIAAVTGYAGYVAVTSQHTTVKTTLRSKAFIKTFEASHRYDPPRSLPPIDLFGVDGSIVKLNDLKGKWRLVNFWATWCSPCITELPQLLELKDKKGDKNFDVVFISLDYPKSAESLKAKMKIVKTPFEFHTFYVKSQELWEKLSIKGVPTNIIIDPKGQMHLMLVGDSNWMGKESLAFIDDLLNNQKS